MENLFLQSPSTTALLGTVGILLVLYIFFPNFDHQRKEPPGPRPLPVVGNLLQLDLKSLHSSLYELSKKYGSVFTVCFGPQKMVVLAGYKTVKQALVNYGVEFGDRLINPRDNDVTQLPVYLLFANGELWKEMRRFALSNLRDYGMGKKAAEEKIIEEIQYLLQEFESHEGKPFSVTKSINYAVSNIISAIIYGSRFDYSDAQFQQMVNRANETIQLSGTPSVQVPLFYNMFNVLFSIQLQQLKQMKLLIKRLQETLNVEMCRGFVDSFLAHKRKLEDSGMTESYYTIEILVTTVGNLFAAGTDTTGTTLRWGLLFMAKYPHIQDQVQEELSRVVGSRQVRAEDRMILPFTDAVIHETQRLANILPIALPHVTTTDVTFQGFFIKKGTPVIPLLTSVLWDETEWEKPQVFNPAHFLDKDGKFVKRDAFMPFSAGRRACLGESLARMELFLFFTSLLQRFRFTPPPGVKEEELDLTPALGFTLMPMPQDLCAVSHEGF
uniref:Cytochrome P450 2K1-like n=1 Tax=Cyclopterus lumpus TaxID=8103 RepID=A0A8C2WHH9_CYCLU